MKIGDIIHFKYNTRHNDFSQPYIITVIVDRGNDHSYIRIKEIEKVIYKQKLKSQTVSDFLIYLDTGEYKYYIRTQKIKRIA